MAANLRIRFPLDAPYITARNIALLAIVGLIILGGILRADAIGGNQRVSADDDGYAANTNSLLADRAYATFKWAPGTSIAFALATGLSGHHSLKVTTHAHGPAQDAQMVIEIATLLLIAVVTWMLAGPWAAVVAVALACTYIPMILITRTYLSEPLGALLLLAAVGAAARARSLLGRPGGLWALAAAGVIAGLVCLTRNDLAIGMLVIALALAASGRPGVRKGSLRAGVYLGCMLITLTPWLVYASTRVGRFVPITTSGPDALFIGTYLPGAGQLYPVMKAFAGPVCRRFPDDCGHFPFYGPQPMFAIVSARYPHTSENTAVTRAALDNLRRYALGDEPAFAGMLWKKFWNMWTNPWSGGNSAKHPDTNRPQHLIYAALAWLGLLGGALLTRRWSLILAASVLLSVSALVTFFNDQPRYNLSLMALLIAYGSAGLWLLGSAALRRLRDALTRRGFAPGADRSASAP